MSRERTTVRERAIFQRERSVSLRSRSVALRAEADARSAALVATIGSFDGRPVGERGDSFALRVPVLPVALRFIRHDLGRWLERCGLTDEEILDLTLVSSEACANAMEHPLAAIQQAIEIGASVSETEIEIVVRDFGSWASDAGESNRGRGLWMIRALMDDVSVVRDGRGTTVTMRRTLRNGRGQSSGRGTGTST